MITARDFIINNGESILHLQHTLHVRGAVQRENNVQLVNETQLVSHKDWREQDAGEIEKLREQNEKLGSRMRSSKKMVECRLPRILSCAKQYGVDIDSRVGPLERRVS